MSFIFIVTEEIGSPTSICYIRSFFHLFVHSTNVYGATTRPSISPGVSDPAVNKTDKTTALMSIKFFWYMCPGSSIFLSIWVVHLTSSSFWAHRQVYPDTGPCYHLWQLGADTLSKERTQSFPYRPLTIFFTFLIEPRGSRGKTNFPQP